MATALEKIEPTGLARIEEIRLAIARIDNIAHAMEATDQAKAIDVYARAKRSRELVIEAIKLRLFAERRAGELARESGKSFRDLTREFDISRVQSRRWLALAMTSEEEIEDGISSLDEREPSYVSVYNEILYGTAKRVERDIYELRDGGFRIYWRAGGRRYTRKAKSLQHARRLLLYVRGKKTADVAVARSEDLDLSRAYSSLRVALQHADAVIPSLTGEARRSASDAVSLMHKAEDELTRARKFLND